MVTEQNVNIINLDSVKKKSHKEMASEKEKK